MRDPPLVHIAHVALVRTAPPDRYPRLLSERLRGRPRDGDVFALGRPRPFRGREECGLRRRSSVSGSPLVNELLGLPESLTAGPGGRVVDVKLTMLEEDSDDED